MVGPPAPSLSTLTFCPQKPSHTHTHTHTHKNFSRDFSAEICPESTMMSPSVAPVHAPIKATDQAIETGGSVFHFEERCTAKNNFETNKFTFSISLHNTVVASSNLSLPLRLSRTVLVHANLSRGTHFLWIFFFFSPEAEINACAGRETQIKNVVP